MALLVRTSLTFAGLRSPTSLTMATFTFLARHSQMAFDRSTPYYYFPQLSEFTPTYNLLPETFTPPISDR
jgi:hypothetical protein